MNLIYLDTETTGLDADVNEVIQVAGLIEINGVLKDEFVFNVQATNYAVIQESALQVNHLTIDMIKSFEPPMDVIRKIDAKLRLYSMEPYIIVGQNPKFDYDMLQAFWKRHLFAAVRPFSKVFNYKVFDLTGVAALFHMAGVFNFGNFRLETIVKELGLTFKGDAHDAMVDIKVTYEAWQWFIAYVKKFNPNVKVEDVLGPVIEFTTPGLLPVETPAKRSTVLSAADFPDLFRKS